ncbi:MAG: RagB/SusD family nutrient uptake outer membrane protein [Bacteroidota bacterium]
MNLRIPLLLGLIFFLSYSCQEEDLTQLDPNRVVPESFFETAEQLDAAVISGYATMRAQHLTLRHYYMMYDMLDDQHMPTSANQIAPEFRVGQQTSSSRHVRELYDALYDLVHRMNTALDGIAANTTVDAAIKTEFEAEAKALRGWAYNEIATLWGGAPIYTTRALSTSDYQPRASREAVFAQAQSDLRFAADNLAEERTLGRFNKGSARGFLARSLMQSGDIPEAKTVLQQIVDMNRYVLLDNFQENFIEENDFRGEALFEVIFAPNGGYNWDDSGDSGWGGGSSRSARAQEYGPFWRNVVPSQELIDMIPHVDKGDAFTDPRWNETIILNGATYGDDGQFTLDINANSGPINFAGTDILANFYKYGVYYKNEAVPGFTLTASNLILMRYADVLLLLAEAEARTNGDLGKARDLINQVRARVGAPLMDEAGIANGTADEIVQAVVNERALELVSEQVRGRDLRRWHAAGILNAEAILGYAEERFLLPLPLDEIINNPMINQEDQNPGYN